MVVHNKKTSEFCLYVDMRKLNDDFLDDLFPTHFTDEVLESVGGKQVYSFTNGFSRYHQIKIAKEDRHNTTFVTDLGAIKEIRSQLLQLEEDHFIAGYHL